MSDARANKICMATLLTNDKFLPGVQVLVHSFRKHCPAEIPIIALVTDEVCKTTRFLLKRKGVKTVVVPKISRAEKSKDGAKEKHWEGAELTKLHIWNLTDYDRVLYIDADCLVMAALDELFEVDLTEHPLAAAPDVFVRFISWQYECRGSLIFYGVSCSYCTVVVVAAGQVQRGCASHKAFEGEV